MTYKTSSHYSRIVILCVLSLLAIIICVWRFRYFHEPFENDLTIRMNYAARSISGSHYYSDLFVFGPPGALWINEIFQRAFGANELCVYIMGCVFSVITLLGVYRCTSLLSSRSSGLLAALIWTVINADLWTQANQPNAEVFINAFLVWAFIFIIDESFCQRKWRFLISGLLFFLATSVKHFIAISPIISAIFSIIYIRRSPKYFSTEINFQALKSWLVVGITAILAWLILFGVFFATNRLPLFQRAMFGDALQYASTSHPSLISNFVTGIRPYYLLPPHQRPYLLLYCSLFLCIVYKLFHTKDWRWRAVLGWIVGTWFSVSFSGRFYPHYYMLWMPLISVGTGVISSLTENIISPANKNIVRIVFAVFLLNIGIRQVNQAITYNAEDAVFVKYASKGSLFTEIKTLGEQLHFSMPQDWDIFELGAYGIYFYANRLSPIPYVDSLYGLDSATTKQYQEKVLPELIMAPPKLLVIKRSLLGKDSDSALGQILLGLLKDVSYVERLDLRGNELTVFERTS